MLRSSYQKNFRLAQIQDYPSTRRVRLSLLFPPRGDRLFHMMLGIVNLSSDPSAFLFPLLLATRRFSLRCLYLILQTSINQ